MQIVIDIPKEQYSLIMQSHRTGVERFISKEAMIYAIKNGTRLPKGQTILDFVEDNYPTEIGTDWERGFAYALDEIEKICKAESRDEYDSN